MHPTSYYILEPQGGATVIKIHAHTGAQIAQHYAVAGSYWNPPPGCIPHQQWIAGPAHWPAPLPAMSNPPVPVAPAETPLHQLDREIESVCEESR